MSKRKLLLADDSITIQKVVNLTFADEGIEVISVGDGNSAMDKLREDAPDLVLADVNMPGLNGYEICEKIKDTSGSTPVILLVGSFEPFDEDEAKRVGADDYLTKPFQSISQLVDKVTFLLDPNGENSENSDNSESSVSSFDTTEEILIDDDTDSFETEAEVHDEFADYGEPGIDDEMIQTDQVGSLPVNDVARFESSPEPTRDVVEAETSQSEVDYPDSQSDLEVGEEINESNETDSDELFATEEIESEEESIISEEEESDMYREMELSENEPDSDTTLYADDESSEDDTEELIGEENQDFIDTQELEAVEDVEDEVEIEDSEESFDFTSESEETVEKDFEFTPVVESSEEELSDEVENVEEFESQPSPASVAFAEFGENDGEKTAELPIPEAASVLELDEMNLLELPPMDLPEEEAQSDVSEQEEVEEEQEQAISEEQEEVAPETAQVDGLENQEVSPVAEVTEQVEEDAVNEPVSEEEREQESTPKAVNENTKEVIEQTISIEMVEIITQKVVEKLSERAIKEIAWEVVPQMADLIIKKMAEEKMKD